jgi:hypothetical protein
MQLYHNPRYKKCKVYLVYFSKVRVMKSKVTAIGVKLACFCSLRVKAQF